MENFGQRVETIKTLYGYFRNKNKVTKIKNSVYGF